mgnify:FL=1
MARKWYICEASLGNTHRLDSSVVSLEVFHDPIREQYRIRINDHVLNKSFDDLHEAKRIAIATLRNKLHALIQDLNEMERIKLAQ